MSCYACYVDVTFDLKRASCKVIASLLVVDHKDGACARAGTLLFRSVGRFREVLKDCINANVKRIY